MGETVPEERVHDHQEHQHRHRGRIAPANSSDYINDLSASTYTINSRGSSIYTIHNSISQDKLVAESPGNNNNTFFKKRPKRNRKELIILCIALIVFVTLTVVFGLLAYYYANLETDICESPECVRTAANLLRSIDGSANPCEDFYAYACGRWSEDHFTPDDSQISHSWFDERQTHMLRNIQAFLKQNDSEENIPEPIQQARTMYQACLDMDILEKLQIKPVLSLLESLSLPLSVPLPGSPSPNFNWSQISLRGVVFLAKEFLFGFDVQPHPRNTTRNYLAVGMPETNSPLPVLHNIHLKVEKNRKDRSKQLRELLDSEQQEVDNILEQYPEYSRFMRRVMAAFTVWTEKSEKEDIYAPDAYLTLSTDQNDTLHRIVANVLVFQINIDLILEENEDELEVPKELSVQELQKIFDEEMKNNNQTDSFIIWSDFFTELFAFVNVTFDPENERILFYDEEYFKDLIKLLAKTPLDILESWMWWQVVSNALPHTDRVMREIAQDYFEDTIGVTSYKRSFFCSKVVNEKMGMAVSYFLANKDHLKGLQKKVTAMMGDIRKAFRELVNQLHWMDEPTKRATIEKAEAMQTFIGYPEWILDSHKLASYYPNVSISRDTHLENLLTINQLSVRKVLLKLGTENSRDEWTTDATTINAFHTFRLNAISIPAGILQFPFYDLGLEAMNYGAIGAILGHELTHGFDNFGRYFDKNGNRVEWWSNKTIDAYLERSACFVNQYSAFYVPEVNLTVNGNKTLGENIADNGGIQEAILAYKLFRQRRAKPEPRLPGLENFTPMQLFFLAYANVWCENPSAISLRQDIENDEHSPSRIRVKGALSNSKEFAEAFHCTANASLNPTQRCTLW